jgi:methylated-DNA-protein-cysteine methyltransferase-like protein
VTGYARSIEGSTRKKPSRNAARRPGARAETPPFERVWRLVKSIPRGRVATYGQLSQLIDGRLTPIGVGWAIRAAGETKIPWQRVVNGQGGISTDNEHPGVLRAVLEAEGVKFGRDGRIDLERYGWRGPRK